MNAAQAIFAQLQGPGKHKSMGCSLGCAVALRHESAHIITAEEQRSKTGGPENTGFFNLQICFLWCTAAPYDLI